jgi:carbon starvation protein
MSRWLSALVWAVVSLAGAAAIGYLAVTRGETISAAWLLVAAVCTYAVGYRFYSKIIAAKIFALDATRATPAERLADGRDFVPTNKWVVFGHHFAAIAGPGPLVGPTLAAQFGFLPGALWIIVGVDAGRRGAGLRHPLLLRAAERQVARTDGEGGDRTGCRIHRARRGARHHDHPDLGARAHRRERAQVESPWGTVTIGLTIPIAMFMGLYLKYLRPGQACSR